MTAVVDPAVDIGLLSPASCLTIFLGPSDVIVEIVGNDWYPSAIGMLVGRSIDNVLLPIGASRSFHSKGAGGRARAELAELHLTRSIAMTGMAIRVDGGECRTLVFVPIDARPIDARPIDARPVDARPVDGGPVDGGPVMVSGNVPATAVPAGPPDRAAPAGPPRATAGPPPLSYGQLNFLALMSHELRTPLNAIVGFAEVIQAQPHGPIGDPKYLDYVQDIWDAGSYLSRIVSDLLVLGRVGLSSEDLRLDRADLRDCVMSAVRFNRHLADQRGISLITKLEAMPAMLVDEKKIIQALTNVVGNAIKYSNNKAEVQARLSRVSGGDIALHVSDTGIGIAADDLAQVFEPFVRSQNVKDLNIQGAGIGLAVVRSIFQAHGGDVAIDSVETEGTTVTLTLPGTLIADQSPEVAPWEISE